MPPEKPGLHITALEAVYKPEQPAPDKHADGKERRFILGKDNAAVAVDIYPTHPAFVRVLTRTGEEVVAIGRVRSVTPHENGILIRNANTECLVDSDGFIILTRTPPELEFPPFQEAPVGQRKRAQDGTEYTQTMMNVGETKEGERVEKYGTVEAAPKPVNKAKDSPLQFVLIVDDPEKAGDKERLEIHATRKARQQLQGYKLVRDDRIEAVLYRHTWQEETIGGDRLTHTRYNLAAIARIERKDEASPAKRKTRRQAKT